ncbi:MAG: hypothetical protein NC043_07790 [Muribaculaceae bacterium]|nr:hypothetical protein [Muribaculaceae bacterium]
MKMLFSFVALMMSTVCAWACPDNVTTAAEKSSCCKTTTLTPEEDAKALGLTLDDYNEITPELREALRAANIMWGYCEVVNNQINVNLSYNEALAKGVSSIGYFLFMEEIAKTNYESAKLIGRTRFYWPDFKKYAAIYKDYADGKLSFEEFKMESAEIFRTEMESE